MDNHSFNTCIRPLNIKYSKIFRRIPRITDYSCTREEYVEALKQAVEKKKPLNEILISRASQYGNA